MSSVTLTIDDREVTVPAGTTIWDAARALEIEVPVLCHDPGLEPVGVCRICAVEVEGARVMAASCVRAAEDGMVVHTASPKVERCRTMLTELLMSEQPAESRKQTTTADDKLYELAIEGERWAVELVLDRCLGKVVEPPDAPAVPRSVNQININLPDPPGGRHAVPGLLDDEP